MRRPCPPALCHDCGVDVAAIGELSYMLRNSAWRLATGDRRLRGHHFMCIGCVEQALGRNLDRHDFALLSVNFIAFGKKSARLLDRLGDFDEACGVAAGRSYDEIQELNHRITNRIRANDLPYHEA